MVGIFSILSVTSSSAFAFLSPSLPHIHSHGQTPCRSHASSAPRHTRRQNFHSSSPFVLHAKKYQFGDITKGLIKKVTKKDKYEFGDLSKHLDKVAKQKVADLRGKEKYEFGDLTRYIDSKVKDEIQEFTNSTSKGGQYKFGDISKEIVHRVITRDYTLDDMIFLFKILLAFGAGLSPVANFLPAKLLIELLDVSIAGDATKRVTAAITSELDKRMKKAFTGDENYQIGDMSKKKFLDYIGKDKYEFGDISKFVLEAIDDDDDDVDNKDKDTQIVTKDGVGISDERKKKLSLKGSMFNSDDPKSAELIQKELEDWDKKFLVQLQEENADSGSGKGAIDKQQQEKAR